MKIAEETDYPFGDTVTLKIAAAKPVEFPLYLRVPRWCADAVGEDQRQGGAMSRPSRSSYVVLEREWKDGDTVSLRLPMQVARRRSGRRTRTRSRWTTAR